MLLALELINLSLTNLCLEEIFLTNPKLKFRIPKLKEMPDLIEGEFQLLVGCQIGVI